MWNTSDFPGAWKSALLCYASKPLKHLKSKIPHNLFRVTQALNFGNTDHDSSVELI